jgi:excisionase family DNA binding protein
LRVVEPGALEAAALAAQEKDGERDAWLEALAHEVEAARYEVRRAQRQYDAVDPEQRLVAAELEARWNRALVQVRKLEAQLEEERRRHKAQAPDLETMRDLAGNLSQVWDAEQGDPRLKKRIVRALIEEILVDRTADTRELQILIHWKGGVHTKLSVTCRRRGQHFLTTSDDIVDAIRVLSQVSTDDHMAALLTRNGFKTSTSLRWTRTRLKGIRLSHGIAVFDKERKQAEGWMTLTEAATYLDVNSITVRRAIQRGEVAALHPLGDGPWVLKRADLDRPEVQAMFEAIRARRKTPGSPASGDETLMFPGWQGDHAL